MSTEEFEKRIKHLDQIQILSGAISSLNRLLIDKGLVEEEELQDFFLDWVREQGLSKKSSRNKKTSQTLSN